MVRNTKKRVFENGKGRKVGINFSSACVYLVSLHRYCVAGEMGTGVLHIQCIIYSVYYTLYTHAR